MFDLNVRYVFRAVRAALRVFLEQGGLASLARSVAAEYGRDGIRMNVVTCGAIAIPVAQRAQAVTDAEWIPMGRAGTAEEVADAVATAVGPF